MTRGAKDFSNTTKPMCFPTRLASHAYVKETGKPAGSMATSGGERRQQVQCNGASLLAIHETRSCAQTLPSSFTGSLEESNNDMRISTRRQEVRLAPSACTSSTFVCLAQTDNSKQHLPWTSSLPRPQNPEALRRPMRKAMVESPEGGERWDILTPRLERHKRASLSQKLTLEQQLVKESCRPVSCKRCNCRRRKLYNIAKQRVQHWSDGCWRLRARFLVDACVRALVFVQPDTTRPSEPIRFRHAEHVVDQQRYIIPDFVKIFAFPSASPRSLSHWRRSCCWSTARWTLAIVGGKALGFLCQDGGFLSK